MLGLTRTRREQRVQRHAWAAPARLHVCAHCRRRVAHGVVVQACLRARLPKIQVCDGQVRVRVAVRAEGTQSMAEFRRGAAGPEWNIAVARCIDA